MEENFSTPEKIYKTLENQRVKNENLERKKRSEIEDNFLKVENEKTKELLRKIAKNYL